MKSFSVIPAHIAGWILFLALPLIYDPDLWRVITSHHYLFMLSQLLFIAYFYLNMCVLVPYFLSNKKIVLFLIINLTVFFILCVVIPWIIHEYFRDESFMPNHRMHPDFHPDGKFPLHTREPHDIFKRLGLYTRTTQFLIVFTVSTGLKVLTQWYREKQRLKELETSMIEAELSFLKSQIHPHFLFNSLNSIYYLALSKDDKAPKAILSLSDFLRFVTIESDKNLIPLEREIKMLEEYLNLQSLRASEKFDLQFELKGDFSDREIMPLTFIPFVENAFKYGISAHIDCFIRLKIEVENSVLTFLVDNSIIQGGENIIRSSGVGLENIKKRLELAYPGHYSLEINNNDRTFSVRLKIDLI
jgi:LytS/YehU family sensor histidine kinase